MGGAAAGLVFQDVQRLVQEFFAILDAASVDHFTVVIRCVFQFGQETFPFIIAYFLNVFLQGGYQRPMSSRGMPSTNSMTLASIIFWH